MRTGRFVIIAFILLGALVVLVAGANFVRRQVVHEPLVDSHNVFIHESYTLSGAVDDAVFVVAQKIMLDADSQVDGDAALIGETITVDGQVDGDLTATGGSLRIGADGSIGGDAMLMGASITLDGRIDGDVIVTGTRLSISRDAEVAGDLVACVDDITDQRSRPPAIAGCGVKGSPALAHILSTFTRGALTFSPDTADLAADRAPIDPTAALLVSALVTTVTLLGVSGLAVTVFPRQVSHIEEAVHAQPRHLMVTGLMSFLFAVGVGSAYVVVLAAVPAVGLILLPVVALLVLGYAGLILAGLVTLALMFGGWLLRRIAQQDYPPLVAAVVGSLALPLLLHALAAIPYGAVVSLALLALLSAAAAGAALTTRVGTRPLRQSYFVQG